MNVGLKALWARIRFVLWAAVATILRTIGMEKSMKHHEDEVAEGGTFTVTGSDMTVFKLPGDERPENVDVDFDESCPVLVCNPHQVDELEWEIVAAAHHHQHKYELKIKWQVSGVRKIRWSVNAERAS